MNYKGTNLDEYVGYTTSRLIDLCGKKFGDLYVICRAPKNKSETRYWVECLLCGKVYTACASHLTQGKSKACVGCAPKKVAEQKFQGCGDIPLTYWNDLKRGAAGEKSGRDCRRQLKFEITIEQAWDLYLKQNRRCALSNIPIIFIKIGASNKKAQTTASLDRIDSDGDYTIDNIQWVHKDVNRMKNIYNQGYFITMCKMIANNNE